MERLTHDELAELLGAYALDAVEPDEAELLGRHLETCPRCREELRAHRETASLLGYIGGPAPTGLWDQIVAGAQEAPPELRLHKAQVLPLASARRRRSLRVRLVAVAAGVAAAAAVALGFQVNHLDQQTRALQAVVQSITPSPTMATVQRALATPGSQHVQLTAVAKPRGTANAVILPSGDGYLYNAKMEPLPSGRSYQLWGIVGDQRISYGLLGSDPTAVSYFRAGGNGTVDELAVTDEVASGVESSTQAPVAFGLVPQGPSPTRTPSKR